MTHNLGIAQMLIVNESNWWKCFEYFIWTCVQSQVDCGINVIVTILVGPYHPHGVSKKIKWISL